ncbi:unnamed protein product [Protopolystoma xenopodis]|uniref:Clathrin/coatomer adaptor adaptin-like N-terminal domain-containing protein n=1 Tax=Protopolystoma xenopodis TaxID=117903 RepID=A0A3S5ACU3_9PLAT|nr:unnamed protein product [Protopolystoma xenopodis]
MVASSIAFMRRSMGFGQAYLQLEKTTVIQEVTGLARTFNEAPLNPRRCIRILTKILVILSRGEKLTKNEATDTFFAMTKLFQSNHQNLRRMVYLVIKELSSLADDVIIVTSSLTKDMTGSELAFRGPAIRALCKITDATMIQSVERYLKQAIVDKSATIASSVLVSSIHLMRIAPGVVRRWTNEIIEASSSSKMMVQYHALGLLYLVRKSDRLAVTKLIQKFTRSPLRSPYAHCLLVSSLITILTQIQVRIVAKQLEEEGISNNPSLFEFLESTLCMKAEMVVYEAARSIVSLRDVTAKEIAPAVSVLQSFCSSHKPVMRYAAVRTLSAVATRHPAAVTACNLDLENMIADSNRSIATLAITTLLKTGAENNVDRLLKHICSFMAEITDEFKVVVLESIRLLATKYPRKYAVLLNFLSGLLRDTSGYTFKKAVVLAMESIIKDIPEAKSLGLLQLCEFIEDCEHMKLTQRILYLIGREGPYLNRPRQFIRYIYNRVVLESAPVKCTATTALARFGAYNEELRPSILVLLQRIMLDEDDEVRDRATFYHYLLSSSELVSDKSIRNSYLLTDELHLSPSGLDRALLAYTQSPSAAEEAPFSLSSLPLASAEIQDQSSVVALVDQSYLNSHDVNGDERAYFKFTDAKIYYVKYQHLLSTH